MNVLAVFRSRTQTLSFATQLKKYGIATQTIPTPQAAKVGCGLSCKFPYAAMRQAKGVLAKGGYSSFSGFYLLSITANTNSLRPL